MAEASSSLTERISDWLIRRRHLLLSAALLLTAAALWPSTHLVLDTSVTNLFSPNDPVLLAYRKSVEAFEGAELVVIAYTDPDLLTPAGLNRVHLLAQQCRELPDVQQVLSLADLPWPPALPDMRGLHLQVQHGSLPAG
ncbi:MAG: hypothetical protein HY000_04320, partial [Planctomycetes bacterium]|nr:hypothetical protein [Planctomycetota bacterium]